MGIAFHWTPSAAAEREKEQWLDQKPESLEQFVAEEFGGSAPLRLDLRSPTQIDEERIKAETPPTRAKWPWRARSTPANGLADGAAFTLRSADLGERSCCNSCGASAGAAARLQARIEELAA